MPNQFSLMKERRFWPLFVTQFLGAFNDNLYKTSVAVLVAYGLRDIGDWNPAVVVSLAAAIFILPFVFVTPLAGTMADKFDKSVIIRRIKIAEIFIVLTAIAGLQIHSVFLLLLALFALGVQSAVFSPSKFAILPQHLQADQLIGGNALLNTGTYLAILAGTILGGLLAVSHTGLWWVAAILLLCSFVGYYTSRFIPEAPSKSPGIPLQWNTPVEALQILKYAFTLPSGVFHAMIGGAWFFFVGATLISQFPNYTSLVLGADNVVLTFFMIIFSVGIALGGLLNERLLNKEVAATFVPVSAFVMVVFTTDLYFASRVYQSFSHVDSGYLMTLPSFLSHLSAWRIVFDILVLSVAGGIFIVPLKSIIQHRVPAEYCSRVVASSAMLDALFILSSAILASLLLSAGFYVHHLFLILAAGSFIVGVYMCALLPQHVLKRFKI